MTKKIIKLPVCVMQRLNEAYRHLLFPKLLVEALHSANIYSHLFVDSRACYDDLLLIFEVENLILHKMRVKKQTQTKSDFAERYIYST